MGLETVARAILRQLAHQAIARDLGDDRTPPRSRQPAHRRRLPLRNRKPCRAGRDHRRTRVSAFSGSACTGARPAPTATRAIYCRESIRAGDAKVTAKRCGGANFLEQFPHAAPAVSRLESSIPLGIRLGSSTTAAATTGPAQRTAPGLIAAGHRPDAALDQSALAAKARRRDRDHAFWQLGRDLSRIYRESCRDRAQAKPLAQPGNSELFPLFKS